MARDIWVISDTHFNHKNILNFRDRVTGKLIRPGFHTLQDMNHHIIERWNSVVKKGDLVYHLGDVFFGPQEQYLPLHKALNGSKRLILGNHDNVRFFAQYELFGKIQIWEPLQQYGILLSHVPLHEEQLKRGPQGSEHDSDVTLLNVHGHIHTNPSPEGPYRCVCVEQTNYTPVNIDELRTT